MATILSSQMHQPDWFRLVETPQQATLLELLETAPRSKGEQAYQMLAAPPQPLDMTDAKARAATVIQYLTCGYRVGDPHPSLVQQ